MSDELKRLDPDQFRDTLRRFLSPFYPFYPVVHLASVASPVTTLPAMSTPSIRRLRRRGGGLISSVCITASGSNIRQADVDGTDRPRSPYSSELKFHDCAHKNVFSDLKGADALKL